LIKRLAIAVTSVALTIGPAGVYSLQNAASAAPGDPFTCRASAVRVDPTLPAPLDGLPTVEPIVANNPNNPCKDQNSGVLNDFALPGNLGNASVLFAQTSDDAGSQAQAGVADVTITVPGAPVIRAEVLTSQANASACTPGSSAKPTLSGSSTVAKVTVGDRVIEPVAGPQTVPLGPLGNLFLNQQTTSASSGSGDPDTITQRALFLDTVLADVVIAESIADFRGNPCDNPPPPQCRDGIDNDGDGKIDFPNDPGCDSPDDNSETDGPPTPGGNGPPQCSDELDNDGDGRTDFPNDPGCESPQDDNEVDGPPAPECSDGMDNDGDGRTDFPSDPGCENRDDDDEENNDQPECSDGVDNDADGTTDFPADRGCKSPTDDDEAFGFINGGGGYDEVDRKTGNEDFVEPGDRLRFGAVLPCDLEDQPGPNLVTTFLGDGNEAQFKLEELTRAFCRNDPFIDSRNPNSEFDTYVGEGTGTLRINGTDVPATAEFILIDRGEPGSPPVTGVDFYQIQVRPFGLPIALAEGVGTLDEGNIQAHSPGRPGSAGPASGGQGSGSGKGGGGKGRGV
jgi:hypothetical protein